MKKKMKLIGQGLFLLVSLFIVSCAGDGFTEESWSSDVKNQQLTSPSADDIKVDKNADGSRWVITWPLVKGAAGFKCTVQNVTNPDAVVTVVNDSIVDGCSLTFPREEDSNYTLNIQALGNKDLNNKDAEQATLKAFSSFSPTWKAVPAGTDLAEWFAANPIPDDMTDEVCVDLAAGGQYTMSGNIDFGGHKAALRCTVASKPAKVQFTGNASIIIGEAFTMKNLEFDASASESAFLQISKTPTMEKGTGDYYIVKDPLYISNVKVSGVKARLIHDNNIKWCYKTAIIDNCVINLQATQAVPVIHFQGGFIVDMTVKNSTIWDNATGMNNYFMQYNNSGRCDRAGFATQSITYTNCTFYNVAYKGQLGNYSGFAGRKESTFTLKNNIFVNCSSNAVPRRFTSGSNNTATKSFLNNTYWYDGDNENVGTWDESGTQVMGDPGFANPSTGDFHYSGSAQKALKLGDPRWL